MTGAWILIGAGWVALLLGVIFLTLGPALLGWTLMGISVLCSVVGPFLMWLITR